MGRRFALVLAAALAAPAVLAQAPAVTPGTEAVVETAKGSFTIRLLPEVAPKHVALFVKTAKAGGYDGTTFHRVIAGGIIQGGDPLTKDPAKASLYGTGGPRPAEGRVLRPALRARHGGGRAPALQPRQRRPCSSSSCMRDQPSLKGQYTIFGEVVSGMEVVDQISTTPADGDKARERVEMRGQGPEKAPE